MGGEGEGRGKQWMRRGRKSSWEGGKYILAQEKEGEQKGESRNEKTVMVKLIVQKENRNKN
jgi:hypothetical protein